MILVFGATGFTGRMVVRELVARRLPVRIAGRSEERLKKLADQHGGLEWAVADVEDAPSVSRAAENCELLVTTVGPYSWWGHIAADAAIEHSIPYVDITGEPAFVRRIFDEYGPRAERAGVAMLPAMGYDYVPGNLAGALALEAAGEEATGVDIGYFMTSETSRSLTSLSGGTLRSLRASSSAMQYGWRGGKLVEERGAKRVLKFPFGDRTFTAISIGGTEHFSLPRLHPQLQEVNVGLGWFGPASRTVSLVSAVGEKIDALPVIGGLVERVMSGGHGSRTRQRSKPVGPDEVTLAESRGRIIAIARGADGRELAGVRLEGPNPYDLSGRLVAWVAERVVSGEINGAGAMGPVEAFGLEPLRAACESFGLVEV